MAQPDWYQIGTDIEIDRPAEELRINGVRQELSGWDESAIIAQASRLEAKGATVSLILAEEDR